MNFLFRNPEVQPRPPQLPKMESFAKLVTHFPCNIYLFKVNKRNTKKMCEICVKLTIKTPKRRQ